MKSVLVTAGVGIGLFAATAAGLLAAQGRLNYEGTRGIPLLRALFQEPKKDARKGGDGERGAVKKPAGAAEARRDEHARLVPRQEPLPYRKVAASEQGADAGAHGEGGAEEQPAKAPEEPASEAPQQGHAAPAAETEPARPTDWQHKVEDLIGEGQYRRGRLFQFQRMESGLSTEELNEILRRAQKQTGELEAREKALDKRKQDLDARDADIRDRQKAVDAKLLEVQGERGKLEREVEEFHRTVLLIKRDEEQGLKDIARTIASLEPKKASDVILRMWQSEEGKVQAIKVMTVMDEDAADAIVGEFQLQQVKEFLEQRLKVVRQGGKDKK